MVPPRLYIGRPTPLEVGKTYVARPAVTYTLGDDSYYWNLPKRVEDEVEARRPADMPSRLSSFFLTDKPSKIAESGGSALYVYEVTAPKATRHEYTFLSSAARLITFATKRARTKGPQYLQDAKKAIDDYWSGKTSPDVSWSSPEYIAPTITVVRRVSVRQTMQHEFNEIYDWHKKRNPAMPQLTYNAHEKPADHPFYCDSGDGSLVPEHASFEAALDDALTRVVRAGMPSVRVVHGSEVAGFDDVADVLLFDEYSGRQAIGEMHDRPEAVIVLHEAGLDLTSMANEAPYTATVQYGPWRSGLRDESTVAVILARDEQRANPARKRIDLTSAEVAKVESAVSEPGLGTIDLTPARGGKFVAKIAPLADAATIIKSLRLIGLDAEELKGEESGRLLVKLPKREPRASRPSALPKPPAGWWNRPVPKDQLCYPSRSDALKRFLDENQDLIQNYGGVDYQVGASEFDAINHKYSLTGDRAARTIADAVWYAMPAGKPYCVERIDLEALNDTSPAREADAKFRLPAYVYEQNLAADEAKRYAQQHEDELEEHYARLAEAEEAEAQRAFAEAQVPIPSLPAPISLPVPDGEAFIDAYIVPSHVVGTAYEPWMEDQLMVTRERRALMRPAAASNPGCGRSALQAQENPSRSWVTKVIAKHYEDMQEEVPAKWLPKIASIKGTGGRKVAAQMKEYGCGAYGCVLPTYDPDVVLKLTTDDTEAEFAHDLASTISAPIVVKYRKTVTLPEEYHGHGTYLLWRQSADEVGNLLDAVKARKGNRSKAFAAIAKQHKAAQRAYDALLAGKPAHDKLDAWREAAKLLGEEVPELRELMRGMIKVLDKDGVFFGDIHDGNLGLVNGKWLIVDPGHVAVITEDA